MSYILDALKKSDQERKRGDIPNLQTVHIPVHAEQKSPRVLYGFIAVLLLVLVFVIGLMVSDNRSPVVEQSIEVIESEKVPDIEHVIKHDISDEVKASKDEAIKSQRSQLNSAADNKQLVTGAVKNSQLTKPSDWQAANVQATVPADNIEPAEKIVDINNVPFLHELADYQQQSIPQMSFAGHVYSSTPSSRSVIINGYAMSEGDIIVQGLAVEQITSSGVVFRFQGELFRVDILQDWSFE